MASFYSNDSDSDSDSTIKANSPKQVLEEIEENKNESPSTLDESKSNKDIINEDKPNESRQPQDSSDIVQTDFTDFSSYED